MVAGRGRSLVAALSSATSMSRRLLGNQQYHLRRFEGFTRPIYSAAYITIMMLFYRFSGAFINKVSRLLGRSIRR